MSNSKKITKLLFSILALCASVGAASASTITGTFNAASYQTISLNVATASKIDLEYLSGYYDPNFLLFDGANNHIIANDDSAGAGGVAGGGVFSHITQNLAAGNYTLLVTYCCNGVAAVQAGATFSATDGFNAGSYYIGGPATLGGVEAYLDTQAFDGLNGTEFTIGVSNATVGAPVDNGEVPEPQSLALFGLALTALALARRRQLRK